jgi:hypothetical protein
LYNQDFNQKGLPPDPLSTFVIRDEYEDIFTRSLHYTTRDFQYICYSKRFLYIHGGGPLFTLIKYNTDQQYLINPVIDSSIAYLKI